MGVLAMSGTLTPARSTASVPHPALGCKENPLRLITHCGSHGGGPLLAAHRKEKALGDGWGGTVSTRSSTGALGVCVCVVGSANPPFMCGEELRRSDHTPARPLIDVFVVMPRLPSPSPFVSVLPSLLFVSHSLFRTDELAV